MEPIPKSILMLIDDTEDSLHPVHFLQRLYSRLSNINVILCYFSTPLPPSYQGVIQSPSSMQKRTELLTEREKKTLTVMTRAKSALIKAGFPESSVHEHVEERSRTVAQHACSLASIKKVDAVLIRKRTSSGVEGFLKGDPASAMLHHCLNSPLWLTAGDIDPSRAAICIQNENASLRSADHAAFMLAETSAAITILHASKSVSFPVSSPVSPHSPTLQKWLATDGGREVAFFLAQTTNILREAGIPDERVQITLIPSRGDVTGEILSYCGGEGIGIVALGHSDPGGSWGFLKRSVTREIMAEFKNMAVWINQ